MGPTDDTLAEADRLLAGIRGQILLVREKQGGLSRKSVQDWVARLREAAETLERLA